MLLRRKENPNVLVIKLEQTIQTNGETLTIDGIPPRVQKGLVLLSKLFIDLVPFDKAISVFQFKTLILNSVDLKKEPLLPAKLGELVSAFDICVTFTA